jgi:isopentenyldiphosphate isomerase
MHFINLIILSDFMQILNSINKHYTKNKHFHKHNICSIIYLLQEQKLNPNKYSEQEINMRNFVQATEYYVHMYAQFGGLSFYGFV